MLARILVGLLLFSLAAHGDDAPVDATSPPHAGTELPQVISVEVTVLELSAHLEIADSADISEQKLKAAIDEARSSGVLENLTRIRLSTIAGQESSFQIGANEPVINGWTTTQKGRSPNYVYQQIGSIAQVTTEQAGDGKIVVALSFEQSHLVRGDLKGDDPAELVPTRIRTFVHKATSIVPDGKTILVSGSEQFDADSDRLETIILVHAATVD